MDSESNINILIAEDNEVSRELMASLLKTQGHNIIGVQDGTEAINAVKNTDFDLALVDLNMAPTGGFDFVKHLVVNKIDLPIVIVTADDSSDVLTQASELHVTRVLQKPVEPSRLISVVGHVLKKYGHTIKPIAISEIETKFTPEQLMQRAVELAERNAKSKKGGPFGSVIANANGEILGEGTNGITSRVDPTAHAEVMAIRQASEKLGRANLEDCTLYCSSEPTMMGKALIVSVGIKKVCYGLNHSEINQIRAREETSYTETEYTQLGHAHALKVLERWEALDDKLSD